MLYQEGVYHAKEPSYPAQLRVLPVAEAIAHDESRHDRGDYEMLYTSCIALSASVQASFVERTRRRQLGDSEQCSLRRVRCDECDGSCKKLCRHMCVEVR